MNDKQDSPGFLDRWSARKQRVAEEKTTGGTFPTDEGVLDSSPPPVADLAERVASADLQSDEPAASSDGIPATLKQSEALESADVPQLTDADMPPIESLSSESDISGFFSKGVSAELKKAALRHVFLQPGYNVRDGLNDYDGDYTYFEPLGDTITSDMKWHTARKERERLEAEAAEQEALERQHAELQTDDEQEQNSADSEPAEQPEQDEAPLVDDGHPLEDDAVPGEGSDELPLADQLAFVSDSTSGRPINSEANPAQRVGGGKLTRVRESHTTRQEPLQQLTNTDRSSKTNVRENEE